MNSLPFKEIRIPPPSTLKVDIEYERKKAMEELNGNLEMLKPYIKLIRKCESGFISVTIRQMRNHNIPENIIWTWYDIKFRRNHELLNKL
jgi:hypothetical protein